MIICFFFFFFLNGFLRKCLFFDILCSKNDFVREYKKRMSDGEDSLILHIRFSGEGNYLRIMA